MRTIEEIRDELKRLDARSGLSAADLDIKITDSYRKLGSYFYANDKRPEYFQFSSQLMDPRLFPDDIFIDTVRHEFCHFYVRHTETKPYKPHGLEWKLACIKFRANPRSKCDPVDDKYRKARIECQSAYRYEVRCDCGWAKKHIKRTKAINGICSGFGEYVCPICKKTLKQSNVVELRCR